MLNKIIKKTREVNEIVDGLYYDAIKGSVIDDVAF